MLRIRVRVRVRVGVRVRVRVAVRIGVMVRVWVREDTAIPSRGHPDEPQKACKSAQGRHT